MILARFGRMGRNSPFEIESPEAAPIRKLEVAALQMDP